MVNNERVVIFSAKNISLRQKIQDNSLTPNKKLNSFIYGSPLCIIIDTSYKLSIMVWCFTTHPVQTNKPFAANMYCTHQKLSSADHHIS